MRSGVESLNPSDLTEIERVLLAVLGAGLTPSAIANDVGFRLDVLSAIALALLRGEPQDRYLASSVTATPELQQALTEAVDDLTERRVLMTSEPPMATFLALEGSPAPLPSRTAPLNFDQHPTVFDRYLAGRCLDELLRHPDVYRFIMARYADSSEIWQRFTRQQL